MPDVAVTLNNLAHLHCNKNEHQQAKSEFEEALEIYWSLVQDNPQVWLPYVAMTCVNIGIFYLKNLPDEEKSIDYCKKALMAALPFLGEIPIAQNYTSVALQVINKWGKNAEAIFNEVVKDVKKTT